MAATAQWPVQGWPENPRAAGDAVRAREAKSEQQIEAEHAATLGFLLGQAEAKLQRQTGEFFGAGGSREVEGLPSIMRGLRRSPSANATPAILSIADRARRVRCARRSGRDPAGGGYWRAMSQQNVEVVRRLVELWEGDAEIAYMRDDAAWARYKPRIEPLFTPGCTFAWVGGGIESEYSGLDGFREGWLDIYGALESARNQFEQIVPVRDKVLVLLRVYARIAGAEHDVMTLAAAVFVMRDGGVARAEFYADRALAFEAVGLHE